MQKQPTPHQQNKIDVEQLMAILLLLFLLFEIFLTAVVLIRCIEPKPSDGREKSSTEEAPIDPPDVGRDSPVFSGGVIPQKPYISASSKTLGNEIISSYAILVDCETGEIVASKDADTAFSPASMTKVMTLIVALENLTEKDLDRRLALTQEIADYVRSGDYEDTSVSLPIESNGISCINDEYAIRDLFYGIGVASAADCTYMIAKEVAGSEEAFVALMNQKAQEMGLVSTHFDNVVGFDSTENYTTAAEMAIIMSYAMQSDFIADVLAARKDDYTIKSYYYTESGEEKSYNVTLKNSLNSRLNKYPAFSLSTSALSATKTGYTTESFMVALAKSNSSQKQYVLVLGSAGSGNITMTQKFKNTMIDMESILNHYIQ